MRNEPLVMIVDDEGSIRTFLRIALAKQGYRVLEVADGRGALSMGASHMPDLVILDLGLPDIDGIDVLRTIREWYGAPIIILSARGKDHDKIAALDAGADDYLSKPFSVGELLARVRVAFRHAASTDGAVRSDMRVGDLWIDTVRRRATIGSDDLHLTPTEYKLLVYLAENAGRVLTHSSILRRVWGPTRENETQYLRVFVANLRRKIEAEPANPRYLLTELGVGYRLAAEDEVAGEPP